MAKEREPGTRKGGENTALAGLRDVDRSTRGNMRVLFSSVVFAGVLLQLLSLRTPLYWLTLAMICVTALYALALEYRVRQGRPPKSFATTVAGLLAVVATLVGAASVNPLTPAAAILCVVVAAWSLGGTRYEARAVYFSSSLGYAALSLAIGFDLLSLDATRIPPERVELRVLVGMTLLMEVMLAVSFWLGRRTRHALDRSLKRTRLAQQELQRRGALLDEARQKLQDVMEGGKLGALSGGDVGPYQLHEVIGRGGMGEIYRALHRGTGEAVAMKVLHAKELGDETSVQRFFREARVSSELESEHVVRVLGSGATSTGAPYLVMELLVGTDLGRYLQQPETMTIDEVVELVRQLADALATADAAGIVHRDLKPQNVFRTLPSGDRPCWKLLDFGVSKLREGSATLTRDAAVGTPAYMSPEQARGQAVDHRSDVFSLAVIAYRALTGQPAFSGPNQMSIMYQVCNQQPLRPSLQRGLSPDFDAVLAIGLAKDRDLRFASARELAAALTAAAAGELSPEIRRRASEILAREPRRSAAPDDVTVDDS